MLVDARGPQRGELVDGEPRDRLAGRRPGAVEARDRLDQHEALGAGGAGHPRGDRVRGDGPRRGQRVALRQQRGRQQDRDDTVAQRPEVHAARRTRDEVGERPAELVHRQDRHPVRGLRPQAEAAVVLADRVRELRAAGHDEQRMARARLARSRAHSARSAPSPASRASPPPTLTTVSTTRAAGAAASSASAAAGAASRSAALHGSSSTGRPRRSATARARNAPDPSGTTGARAREARAHLPRRRLDLADLLGVEMGGDRLDLAGLELLGVGADEPRDALARALDARRPPVRRRARVGLGRQVPEDQVHVGADREQLGGDRAPAPADGDARRDRREVGAQRARVDELARQQPVEVGATRRRRRGRPRSGSRRRSCCPRRASARPRARAPTASALATQLAAATSSGRARASARLTSSPAVVNDQHRPGDGGLDRVEHEADALALGPERVGELRRHRQRHELRRLAGQLGHDVAHDGRQRLAVANDVVRAQDRAHARRRRATPPSC